MRNTAKYGALACAAFFGSIAAGACTYDFDGLVAQAGAGGGGPGGSSGSGGSAAGGSADAGDEDGTGGAAGGGAGSGGTSGSGGSSGKGGTGGTTTDGGKGGTSVDAAIDRASDARDAAAFDCAAVNGTVFQGHCYYPSPTATTWDVASTIGCSAPSHLAVIRSAGEQNAVAGILPGEQRWIGLRKRANSPNVEASFEWVTREALGTYRLWEIYEAGANEPNYTGECVRMQPSNSWGDAACSEMKPAVCERE
jgi:hypothetical protein